MLKKLANGVLMGFVLGLVYAWSDTLVTYTLVREFIGSSWPPFTSTTLHMVLMILGWCSLMGGFFGVIGAKLWEKHPNWFVFAIALPWVGAAIVTTPENAGVLALGLMSVSLFAGLGYALLRFGPKHKMALGLAIPVMLILWYGALDRGIKPPLEREDDPDRPVPSESVPNILWVVYDTTRADRVSAYGYSRKTTPVFDELAGTGALFEHAYATASWTLASHASMFTGLYSSQNNCQSDHHYLDDKFETVAERLYKIGYNTALFTGNPWLEDYTGLSRGFSVLHPSWRNYTIGNLFVVGRVEIMFFQGGQDKGAKESREAFKRWMAEKEKDKRPFFAFVNYMEPHNPYHQIPFEARDRFLPPGKDGDDAEAISRKYDNRIFYANDFQATQEQRSLMMDVYDGGIHYADKSLGDILEVVRKTGRLKDTLVIVAADHGELFGEHDTYVHEYQLYQPLISVPLMLHWPGRVPSGVRLDRPVELIDLYTTVLEYAGLGADITADVRGRSLIPVMEGGGDPARPVFAEVFPTHIRPLRAEIEKLGYDPDTWRLWSVKVGDLSLIRFPDGDRLFDLSTDKEQTHNLVSERTDEAMRLGALIDQFILENPILADPNAGPRREMDEATKARLKALGYVLE